MGKEVINPEGLFQSTNYGFSQIVVTNHGKHVFISGQVAWDKNREIVGKNNLKIQTEKAIQNIKTAIELAGGTLENIVVLRIYKVKYKSEDSPIIASCLKQYFGTLSPPASTWISVDGLANADFMIEIEAEAII